MKKVISNVKSQNHHLNVNEEFFISLTSKYITYFIDGFTLAMKSQSNTYLLSGSEHYIGFWALKLKCTQYGFVD